MVSDGPRRVLWRGRTKGGIGRVPEYPTHLITVKALGLVLVRNV